MNDSHPNDPFVPNDANDATNPHHVDNAGFPGEAAPDDIDLSEFSEVFAEAPEEGNESDAVPDGKYEVNVEKAELGRTKTSNQRVLKWTLRILGPQFAGRMLWRNNMIVTDENVRWLKRDLVTCGLRLQRIQDLPSHLSQLLDVKLEVVKRTKGEYVNVHLNRRIAGPTPGGHHGGSGPDGIPF